MKILLLGKNGQVGWELQRSLQPLGTVLALDRNCDTKTNFIGDIANYVEIEKIFKEFQPNVIVNATAYTAVDKAESEQEQANLINHLAVQHLAELTMKAKALLIHYSTDYVFSGNGKKAWVEHDLTSPHNMYGQTKRNGEIALERSGVNFINFRTSWVYGTHGNNFIKTMLKLAQNRDELSVISDQIGVPTGAALIADITSQVIRYYDLKLKNPIDLHGHYHLVPQGKTSWFDYAEFIFEIARKRGLDLQVKKVNPIPTTAYPTPAKRPLNSRLNTNKLQQNFQISLPNWQQGVEHVLGEII